MKILLMGPQGSGKGTIGEMLSKKMEIPLVSVGDILRDVPKTHPRYQELQDSMDKGMLAPYDLVAELLKDRVSKDDCKNGYVLDGWCRSLGNLEYFDPKPDKVILLNISRETSVRRLGSRRTCEVCGSVFNIISVPPKNPDVCDKCGGKLIQRDDDTEEAVNKRLDIYYSETQEVIDYYKSKGILLEVDGQPSPDVVFQNVLKALDIHPIG